MPQDEGRHKHDPKTPPAQQGEEEASGSAPGVTSDDDVGEMVEEVTGEEPEPGKPFSIAEEVEKDEKARRGMPPKPAETEEEEPEK